LFPPSTNQLHPLRCFVCTMTESGSSVSTFAPLCSPYLLTPYSTNSQPPSFPDQKAPHSSPPPGTPFSFSLLAPRGPPPLQLLASPSCAWCLIRPASGRFFRNEFGPVLGRILLLRSSTSRDRHSRIVFPLSISQRARVFFLFFICRSSCPPLNNRCGHPFAFTLPTSFLLLLCL